MTSCQERAARFLHWEGSRVRRLPNSKIPHYSVFTKVHQAHAGGAHSWQSAVHTIVGIGIFLSLSCTRKGCRLVCVLCALALSLPLLWSRPTSALKAGADFWPLFFHIKV